MVGKLNANVQKQLEELLQNLTLSKNIPHAVMAVESGDKQFYWAGAAGPSLALQMGHRKSEDFDFFADRFDTQILANSIAIYEPLEITAATLGSLHALIRGIKISFFLYPYPLLFPACHIMNIQLADLKDIALMKIVAIANRGSSKDFVDLFFICQSKISLDELLLSLFPQ